MKKTLYTVHTPCCSWGWNQGSHTPVWVCEAEETGALLTAYLQKGKNMKLHTSSHPTVKEAPTLILRTGQSNCSGCVFNDSWHMIQANWWKRKAVGKWDGEEQFRKVSRWWDTSPGQWQKSSWRMQCLNAALGSQWVLSAENHRSR